MKIKCEYCNKEFVTYNYKRSKHHYCSRECSCKDKNTKIKANCMFCNKEFYKRKNDIKKHIFCSKDCLNKWQSRNKIKLTCKTCGKVFLKSPSWLKQKNGYFCSLECRNKNEEWRKNSFSKANHIQCKKKGLNKLELKGNEILNKLNIEYETQYLINNKICVDVFIPTKNIIIQWDGNYWHGKGKKYEELEPRIKKRVDLDNSQDKYLRKCGFIILRFWENEVKEKEKYVYDIIKRAIQ